MTEPNEPPTEQEPTAEEQKELDELTADLQKQADEWRAKLADPATKALIASGKLTVSPMVTSLLAAFPPRSTTSTSG